MNKEQLKRIFDFLEEKEEHNKPLKLKLIFNEPLTEEDFNRYGDLDLSNLEITSLPEGLKVHRDLDLYNSKIKILPKGLEVGGGLNIAYSSIFSLPKGLEVGGSLFIQGTDLTKYTDQELREMVKPGFIREKIVR